MSVRPDAKKQTKEEKYRMKMTEMERKLIRFLEKHGWLWLYAAATVLSMIARFTLRGVISGDMFIFLRPWAEIMKENGGIHGLGQQLGNYGVLYQTIIALMTYLPIQHEYAYKIFSMVFDFALAAAASAMVREFSGSRLKAFLTYTLLVMLPSVMLNSAAWGQCDSVFTFFCVLCFWLLLREKPFWAFVSWGIAFAFKLQAIFLAPFIVFYYLKARNFSLLNLLVIPLMMILSSLAGILQGRSILAPFQIYAEQAGTYPSISLNYPSFWSLLIKNETEDYYAELSVYCIVFALAVLLVELILLIRRKERYSKSMYLFAAFLMTYTCVLFLPAMHERYSYPYLIFGLMLAVLEPETAVSFVLLMMLDLQTYGAFLFETEAFPWNVLGFLNTACFLSYAFYWGRRIFFGRRELCPENPEERRKSGSLREEK